MKKKKGYFTPNDMTGNPLKKNLCITVLAILLVAKHMDYYFPSNGRAPNNHSYPHDMQNFFLLIDRRRIGFSNKMRY